MAELDDCQHAENILNYDPGITSQATAELMQIRFTRAVSFRRTRDVNGEWIVQIDRHTGNGWELYNDRHYRPNFVVRAVTTNDKNGDGEHLYVDIVNSVGIPVRLYAGLDRPWGVTRVHVHSMRLRDSINSFILLG